MNSVTADAAAPRGRPRDPRLDDAIVDATIDLLAERGYHDLSLAAVAERAGTTTPSIYRRWSSKADLVLHAVFRTDGDDVVADTGDLEEDVRTMVRWALDKLGNPSGRAALAGLLGEPASGAGEGHEQMAALWRRLAEMLDELRRRGDVGPHVDPGVFLVLLAGPATMAGSVLGAGADDDRWVEPLVRAVVHYLRVDPERAIT